MKRSEITVLPEYFDRYINLVEDIELVVALERSYSALTTLDLARMEQLGDKVYAPGKWTVRDIFQHLVDTERILSYRALRFARKDRTPLPGFDENNFAEASPANTRNLEDIINELKIVRQSSLLMCKSFDDGAMNRVGVSSNKEISVVAIGFTIVGHQAHHLAVIERLYIPLLGH